MFSFQKYHVHGLKHMPPIETQLSLASCEENKSVLLGLALSKARGVYHQNNPPINK